MRFSIIIPTRNRLVQLDRCLTALGALDCPQTEFELLVVDDASDPPADEIVARHATGTLSLRYLRGTGHGPARARNAALLQAQGDYVFFTDDDCIPDPGCLSAFSEAFSRQPDAAFGGHIIDDPQNGIFGVTSQLLVTFLYEDEEFSASGHRFFCSNNLAMPRRALLALGGFDESFPLPAAEDRDLCARWLQQGELHFLATAVVQHHQKLTLAGFWRQHFRYGRGAYQFWLRRRNEGHQGNRIQPLRFYRRMLTYPFGRTPLLKAVAMSALLGLSQLAVGAGYVAERKRTSFTLARSGPDHVKPRA